MKIKFQNLETSEVLSEWELIPPQERFWNSEKKFVLFSGGYGCVSGDTKILNADTGEEIEIRNIHSPLRVFSHNGKKAWALTPIKFAPQELFKVKTTSYEFIGTAGHALFTAKGWKRVGDLLEGEPLLVSSPCLPYSTSESFLSVLFSNVLHWIRRFQGFLGGYHPVFHFYGGQPRLAGGIALELPPLPSDVHEYNQDGWSGDGRSFSEGHTLSYHESFLLSKSDSFPFEKHPPVSDEENHISSEVFEHASVSTQFFEKLYGKIIQSKVSIWFRNVFCGSSVCSYPYPTMKEERVQSISSCGVDNYYDLHVLGTNSYYAQGFFHHNTGKSLILTLKAIDLSLRYPKNYILMGRRTYPELRDTLLKEFFTICPEPLIKDYFKSEGRVIFHNGSEIIFRHLDTIAESEIRSLNLGSAFIDQAEDIPQAVVIGLRGRLRRQGVADKDRKIYLSCNPALTWLFAEFKQNPKPEYEVIEASTLDNRKNLPESYVEDLLKYPESYKKQYVYGIWDSDLLSDRVVFAREHVIALNLYGKDPVKTREGLEIHKEFVEGHKYQMGVDAAEGVEGGDEAAITIVDLTTEEEVASWGGRVTPDVLAEKVSLFASFYQDKRSKCLIVPEMNSIGLALVNKLNQDSNLRVYRREEFDKKTGLKSEKEGWRMTRQTKPLLVARFQELLRLREPKVYSRKTLEQFKTFVHTTESKLNGMGAEGSFHDDRLISCLLAFWEKGKVAPGKVIRPLLKVEKPSMLKIINGKAQIVGYSPELLIDRVSAFI